MLHKGHYWIRKLLLERLINTSVVLWLGNYIWVYPTIATIGLKVVHKFV